MSHHVNSKFKKKLGKHHVICNFYCIFVLFKIIWPNVNSCCDQNYNFFSCKYIPGVTMFILNSKLIPLKQICGILLLMYVLLVILCHFSYAKVLLHRCTSRALSLYKQGSGLWGGRQYNLQLFSIECNKLLCHSFCHL